MEVTDDVCSVDVEIWCLRLQWEKAVEVDRALKTTKILRYSEVKEGEYYRLAAFSTIFSKVSYLLSNIYIIPFTDNLRWLLHCFYLNRFIIEKVLKLSVNSESVYDAKADNLTYVH